MSNAMITTNDILTAITSYTADNERPCPKTFLAQKFGVGVLDMLDSLKKTGIIEGKRGRNGGFIIPNAASVTVDATPVMVETMDEAPSEAPSVPNEPVETISQDEADRVFASLTGISPVETVEQDVHDQLDEPAPF
jgi:DNA-binding IscR family transcriptional regulator